MEKHTIDFQGDSIAVQISPGDGPSIVMIHGNSASSRAFKHQLEGDFGATYRVIAFDLPGHGESDSASDPATYSLPGYVQITRAVATAFNALDGVYLGWSLGGHVVLEGVPDLPEAAGFAIFGTPPLGIPLEMEQAFKPHPTNGMLYAPDLNDEQAKTFADSFFRPGITAPAQFLDDIKQTDGQARANFGLSVQNGRFRDEQAVVQAMEQPLLILHGVEEQLVSGDYITGQTLPTLWRGAVQMIDGAGHAPQWEAPSAFNAVLGAFVDEVSQS